GHPVLSVKTSWQPEDKLVKLVITQTQDEPPFAFPLTVELVAEDTAQSVTLEREIDERELTLYLPMPDRPRAVRVDPGLTLLAEIKETKSEDLWKQQLIAAPTVVERIRAAQHYGESKREADRKLLAAALAEDDFYGVRVEAAKAAGRSGGDLCRDALIDGLDADHPKVRRACAEALAKF